MIDQAEVHRMAHSKEVSERREALIQLEKSFSILDDKEQATKDLIALTKDKDSKVRMCAADALGSAFAHVTDKEQTWKGLLALTKDKNVGVRIVAAQSLGSAFAHVTDKEQATKDLLAFTKDEDSFVRTGAAYALGSAFAHVTDKEQATKDLLALTKDKNSNVRCRAAESLGPAIAHVTDKEQATKDLLAFTKDEDSFVRVRAAYALGSAFAHVTDKEQATKDLLALTEDKGRGVQASANHSLGRVYIFKATESESEEDYRKNLETALEFFEESNKEGNYSTKFCLPFYRSFYTITFKGKGSEAEVEKSLNEAKLAMGSSESKEILLEALEKLAEVLETARNARETGLNHQELLAHCSNICNHVDQLMNENKEKTPVIYDLYKKARPSFDKTVKELIAEVKEKAKNACREAKGTPYENLACNLNKEAEKWEGVDNRDIIRVIERFIKIIKTNLPVEEAEYLCKELETIKATKNTLHLLETIIDDCFILLSKADTPEKIASIQNELVEVKEKLGAIENNTEIIIDNTEQLIASIKEIKISLAPGIQQHIQVTVGLSGFGSGVQKVITIPINKISYQELQEDLGKYSGKLMDIKRLPKRLRDKILGYIRENEDELIE